MTWNLVTECIAFVIVCIILVYSQRSSLTPSLKNRVFQACLITTVVAISLNIASTLLIEKAPIELLPLTWVVTMLYFIITPLISVVYYYYMLAVVSETNPKSSLFIFMGSIPYALYFFCVLSSSWTQSIFYFDAGGAYHQGALILTTYLVFYFYCVLCLALSFSSRTHIDPTTMRILAFFPLLAVAVIVIQQIFPQYILSGSAAACALLIVYLYLQNKQISIDFLTGLPNRQEFSKMLSLRQRHATPSTFVIVSINNFKFVNDKFGHRRGDAFLKEFAAHLTSIANTPWLYRYSGDQFVVLFEGSRRKKAQGFIALLQQRMAQPWELDRNRYSIALSIGVVDFPEVAIDSGTIINALEYMVLESKKAGPNIPCTCTSDMVSTIKRKHQIADILRETLAADMFEIYFQPIWSIREKKFITAEALCRLDSVKLGPISPAEFIPIAEQTGLIVDMTYQILEKVCRFIKTNQTGASPTPLESVSVNFSALQFLQDDLVERTLKIIADNNISCSSIKIEITESVFLANPNAVRVFMRNMHDCGIRFCLDDFGTGFSNLETMLELPFDIIKLDKSIVWKAAARTGEDENFLKHFTAAFKAIGSTTLAEGVETEAQSRYIETCGCELIQGFWYAKPLTASEAYQVIADNKRLNACNSN